MFHLRCLRRILGIICQEKVPNNDVLLRAGIPSMFALLRQRRLGWLSHVHRMDDGRITRISDSTASLPLGQGADAAPSYASRAFAGVTWNRAILTPSYGKPSQTTETCGGRRQQVSQGLKSGKAATRVKNNARRARRIACHQQDQPDPRLAFGFICQGCSRDCKSRIAVTSTATQDVVPW